MYGGYRDNTYGCVSLFERDAQWFNESFVDIATQEGRLLGTKAVVENLLLVISKK